MVSPTLHVKLGEGVSIVGTGGVFPGLIVTVATSKSLKESVTRTETVTRSRGGVRVRRVRERGVAEGAVAVEVPRVRQRVAVGIGGTARVEAHRERRRAVGRIGVEHRDRRLVVGVVADATDRPADEVDVVQVTARTGDEVDGAVRTGRSGGEGLDLASGRAARSRPSA